MCNIDMVMCNIGTKFVVFLKIELNLNVLTLYLHLYNLSLSHGWPVFSKVFLASTIGLLT